MNHTLLGISVSVFVLGSGPRVFADHISEVLDTWNPQMAAGLCGLAFDHTTGNVWVYECHAPDTAPDQRVDRAGACARSSATLLLRQAP